MAGMTDHHSVELTGGRMAVRSADLMAGPKAETTAESLADVMADYSAERSGRHSAGQRAHWSAVHLAHHSAATKEWVTAACSAVQLAVH
jgi:hypothetical protein